MTWRPLRTARSGTLVSGPACWGGWTQNGWRRAYSAREVSAPHGVIIGPDGAAWVTDGGKTPLSVSIP